MRIFFTDAPGGSGKTYAIAHKAIGLVQQGHNVLIIQPTKELIDQTKEHYFGGVHCEVITSNTISASVIGKILDYLQQPYPEPHILMITWLAFERLPDFNQRELWHVFVDEVPQVYARHAFKARKTHSYITNQLQLAQQLENFAAVHVNDRGEMRSLSEAAAYDDALSTYADVARQLKSLNFACFVDHRRHAALLAAESDDLTIYTLLNPSILHGFASVTIAGARFKETLLYRLWSQGEVEFMGATDIDSTLRYREHVGFERLTIHYAFDRPWSKCLRDSDAGMPFAAYCDAVQRGNGDKRAIWIGNNDIEGSPFKGNQYQRLPNYPHGLNNFQEEYDNVVCLSALNPSNDLIGFLESVGLSREEVLLNTYKHCVYQAVLRCSLRNPDWLSTNHVFVPDQQLALWLQSIFQGSSVERLPVDYLPPARKIGRPKKFANASERQKAHRARRRSANAEAACAAALLSFSDVASAHKIPSVMKPASSNEMIL
jgi:hypothetical protein